MIGLDLFLTLRFSISRIPVDYLDTQVQPTLITSDEPDPIISPNLTDDEQDKEFKQAQATFLQQVQPTLTIHENSPLMQPGTFCTLPESVVELPISEGQQIYVRQYFIPHTLVPIMNECVDK